MYLKTLIYFLNYLSQCLYYTAMLYNAPYSSYLNSLLKKKKGKEILMRVSFSKIVCFLVKQVMRDKLFIRRYLILNFMFRIIEKKITSIPSLIPSLITLNIIIVITAYFLNLKVTHVEI